MINDPTVVLSRIERLAEQASAEARALEERLAELAVAEQENHAAQARLVEIATRGRLASDVIEAQEKMLADEAEAIAHEQEMLIAQRAQVQQICAPIHQVRDACKLLSDGLLEVGFAEKKWLIGHLVDVIYVDQKGWELVGRLPGMEASGTFKGVAIREHTS
jgi:hypothetical protein